MIWLFDQDGVLADWQSHFNLQFKNSFPHIDAPFLSKNDNWHMTQGLDQDGVQAIRHVMELPGFYADLEPAPGASEVLNTILDRGDEVFICTTPYISNPTCASDKIAWVEKHIGKGWGKRMIITSDKTAVKGDILIDDRPDIHGAFSPEWEHVVFSQPYNLATNIGQRRIESLYEWEELIHAYV